MAYYVDNGKICNVEFYDYEGNWIATERHNGVSVMVKPYYKKSKSAVGKVVFYIWYEDKLYTAEFSDKNCDNCNSFKQLVEEGFY